MCAMFGAYANGEEPLPRVAHISVARFQRELPRPGEPLEFLMSIHEEGTGITWQQNARVDAETELEFLDLTRRLYEWSLNRAWTRATAQQAIEKLGRGLSKKFIGQQGEDFLEGIGPSAVLMDVDETILNLPWELIATSARPLSHLTPFGRLVTTRVFPRPGRDPLHEDTVVRILGVANPTLDLVASEREIRVLEELEGDHGSFRVEVTVLKRDEATGLRFRQVLATGDFDILHFAGHAGLDRESPERSALQFADGMLEAEAVLGLPWKKPPYFVFNSACESGRATGGRRLVTGETQANGLAAAFLSAGTYGYAGYFWPVTDVGAAVFAEAFYNWLFEVENLGVAFLKARQNAVADLWETGDLTGYSAVLFGDAASKHRRDLAMAA